MPRKPVVPKIVSSTRRSAKGLAVKDSLREVRFNLRHGARRLVQAVEFATHRHDNAVHGPLGLLSEPFNLAVRTTASLLSNVDHAAVDLLSSDGPYRSMAVPLSSSASYFTGPCTSIDLRPFSTDHYWRYRHWLAMRRRRDVFVHEQAIEMAGAQVAEKALSPVFNQPNGQSFDAEMHLRATVPVIQSLMCQNILSKPALSADESDDDLATLADVGAVAIVLAGEIATHLHGLDVHNQFSSALRLADEIAVADRVAWERALHCLTPVEAMGRWLAFVLRHM